jgi:putrescine aminotransferase
VILEPVQGEGGIHLPPTGYLRAAREICDKTGALLILDEVQTGMGRTGKVFACEHEGVSPDLMTLAKALGGGVMPIGACMGTSEVWEKVYSKNPLMHTSTFGGNPLACAAALAACDVLEEEGLASAAEARGMELVKGLRSVDSPLVAEVRGLGLMIGVEFAFDEVGELVIAQMMKRDLVAAYTLNNPRVVRFEPPLTISSEEVSYAVRVFGEAVAETEALLNELGVLA